MTDRFLSSEWARFTAGQKIRCPATLQDRRRKPRAYDFERRSAARLCNYASSHAGVGTVVHVRVYRPEHRSEPIGLPYEIRECRECNALLQVVHLDEATEAAGHAPSAA